MNTFESSLNRYVLHDTVITFAKINDGSVSFVFEQGVFFQSLNPLSLNRTGSCSMHLYIRDFDKNKDLKSIYARMPDKGGVGLAVYNRLVKAAGFNIVTL